MRTALEIVNDIQIATPCTADWHAMAGDDRARHCGQCDKKVFNIENLTAQATADLILEHEGHLCVRLHRRKDGTVLTADCPIGLRAKAKHAWRKSMAYATACLGWLFVSGCREQSAGTGTTAPPPDERHYMAGGICAPPQPPVLMGDICPPEKETLPEPRQPE